MRYNKDLLCLILNRIEWENNQFLKPPFTKKDLDRAEKSNNGFVGMRSGVNCFMAKPIPNFKLKR